jgi:sugar phosphate isomerase/epimerase
MCKFCDAKLYQENGDLSRDAEAALNREGLEGLLKILGGGPADHEQAARLEMDEQIQTILDFAAERENAMALLSPDVAGTPQAAQALAEGMAALLMFRETPSAIAYIAALLAIRHRELLEKWGDLAKRVGES